MNLKDLKREMPYKWRVQSFSKYKPEATCVAYIDARDAMDLLDDVCGPGQWKDDYKDVLGQQFCGVSIKIGEEWVTKWDTGTESNIEKEKGQASDSFKRAGVKWGVGRFLYSLPVMKIAATEKQSQGVYPKPIDDKGRWLTDKDDLTDYINSLIKSGKSAKKAPQEATTPPVAATNGTKPATAEWISKAPAQLEKGNYFRKVAGEYKGVLAFEIPTLPEPDDKAIHAMLVKEKRTKEEHQQCIRWYIDQLPVTDKVTAIGWLKVLSVFKDGKGNYGRLESFEQLEALDNATRLGMLHGAAKGAVVERALDEANAIPDDRPESAR